MTAPRAGPVDGSRPRPTDLDGLLVGAGAAHPAPAVGAFHRPGALRRTGTGVDLRPVRQFPGAYRAQAHLTGADLRGLPRLLGVQRLGKVLDECDNPLLTPAVTAPQESRTARFARTLRRERARVQRLKENLTTLTEGA